MFRRHTVQKCNPLPLSRQKGCESRIVVTKDGRNPTENGKTVTHAPVGQWNEVDEPYGAQAEINSGKSLISPSGRLKQAGQQLGANPFVKLPALELVSAHVGHIENISHLRPRG